jgi:hypothetical protein
LLLTFALPLRLRRGNSRKKGVTSLFFHGYSIVVCVLIGIMGFGIAALARSPAGFGRSSAGFGRSSAAFGKPAQEAAPRNAAVALRSCLAYRVPDPQGAITAQWMEGQPVRVRSVSAGSVSNVWAYAESSAGDAGWVNQENLIFY